MKKFVLIPLLAAVVSGPLVQAHDWGWGGRGPGPGPYYSPHYVPHGRVMHSLPDGFVRLFIGGLEYFYWEGMFYRMAAGGYMVVPAPVGAVVTAIPAGYQHVIVDGIPYYTINGVTYMQTAYGYYQVVPTPQVVVMSNAVPVPQSAVNIAPATPPPPPPAPSTDQKAGVAPALENTPVTQCASSTKAEDVFTVNIPNAKGTYTPVTLKRSGNGFIGPQGEFYTEFPRVEQLKVMYGK